MKTGTGNSRARSSWKRIMNPQVVVSACTPSRTSSRPAAMNGPSRDGSRSVDEALQGRSSHRAAEHREGEGGGVADITGDTLDAGIHHQDADRGRESPWHFAQACLFLASAVKIDNRRSKNFLTAFVSRC